MSRAMGRYELVRPLARGGMAEVYLARRRAAGVEKWLVVKRIRAERATDARFLDMFVREAKLSMSLVHQNIVPVFDFGRSADQVFLAMERVEGKDLGASVTRAGAVRLPPLVAAFVAAECCQALDYAHTRRGSDGAALAIVHRDVTPRNVLLSWNGEVKLTDFGIASLGGDDGAARGSGTPAYMAPEQAKGERVDHRADIYSLGLVLREALTGERARGRGEREATLALARTGELEPWPAAVELPAALRAIVERATEVAPDARFADARAMLAELDAVIVAERAARKVDAPARQLAAWLDATWQGERDEPVTADAAIDGDDMLSFLDDDAGFGAIGTGTERSMASTAAEGPSDPAPAPAPRESTPVAAARSRGVAVMIAIVGVVGVAAIAAREYLEKVQEERVALAEVESGEDGEMPVRVSGAAMEEDVGGASGFGLRASGSGDQKPEAGDRKPAGDRKSEAGSRTPTAGLPTQPQPPTQLQPPTQTAVSPPRPTTAPAMVQPHAAMPRKVTINSQPWSNFTIDSDPAQHQTIETVALLPGPHVIRFVNPELHLEATATIDVPADRDIRFVEPLR